MKRLTLLSLCLIFSVFAMATELFLLPTGSLEKTKEAFSKNNYTIHFYNDDFVIGSTNNKMPAGAILLDENAWTDTDNYYFILYFKPADKENYIQTVSKSAKMLHQAADFLVVATNEQSAAKLFPAVHGGMIRIANTPARFPSKPIGYTPGSLSARDDIFAMIGQVDIDTLEQFVQHLQDYGTRNAYKAGSILAQNWILSKFESYGLAAELHDFSMPNGPASDNVIATLTGTQYPDEYVVLGAHYDSYAGGSNEPGADDNATGTAGILEAARILSQYEFDRSIIFATWSGEEYGLYGSGAWASQAAANGMNILGYFNIDMAGYLKPGDPIHTDIIAPSSAYELRQFYKDVCAIYLPDFQTFNGALAGGDSDHTSFNNNGFQGIFPFEDSQDYSPYIHTANDLIGPSVNNFEQHRTFVQATVACVVTMSSQLPSPQNLVAMAGDQEVNLEWDTVAETDFYNIYRNAEPAPYATSEEPAFLDTGVENGTPYSYYVTAIFLESGEESGPSNPVTVIPMPPIALPFFDDFETGAPYWTLESSWGLQQGIYHSSDYSLTESPAGNYTANMNASTTLRALNFTGATSAQVSFWSRYNIESDYDFMYLEVSTNGSDWNEIASYTGNQNTWVLKTYPLDNYLGETNVIIRFRFTSDVYIEAQGMFIDDLEVMINGVGLTEEDLLPGINGLVFHPNPASNITTAEFSLMHEGITKLQLFDAKGMLVNSITEKWMDAGSHTLEVDISGLKNGVYYGILENSGRKISSKLIISR
jgi:hypothetical protein